MRKRVWKHQAHVDAGYHEQEWGDVPTPDHDLLGEYEGYGGVRITVSYIPKGVTGNPEFELAWADGHKVTVVDDATVLVYLIEAGAATKED